MGGAETGTGGWGVGVLTVQLGLDTPLGLGSGCCITYIHDLNQA